MIFVMGQKLFQIIHRYRYLFFVCIMTGSLPVSGLPCASAGNNADRVLVLHSYHQGFEWTDQIMEGIESVLKMPGIGAELMIEYMDTKSHAGRDLSGYLKEIYAFKYGKIKPDIIIVADDNALSFLLLNRKLLFPGIPVVFCGINHFSDSLISNQEKITGVAEDFDFEKTLDIALTLHPGTRRIAIVSDITCSSNINLERMKLGFPAYRDRLTFIELTGLDADRLKQALHDLPDDALVIHNGLYRDGSGRNFSLEKGLAFVTENCRVPVYTLWQFMVKQGVLGGMVVSGFTQGEKAARMAVRILKGEPPEHIPVLRKSPNRLVFDHDAMVRFGIRRSDLPEHSLVLNIPKDFYTAHKTFVLITLLCMIGLLLIIFILAFNISTRKTAELELKKYRDHLEDLVDKRTKELKDSLLEKEVLLKEIHHRVKNNMQVISSILKLQALSLDDKGIKEVLTDCQGRVQAMALVHEILYGTKRLASVDFKVYTTNLIHKISYSHNTRPNRVELMIDAEEILLGPAQATPVGLIVYEAVSNSFKHAFPGDRKGEIHISLKKSGPDAVELILKDNGIGISDSLDWRNTNTLGLQLIILLSESQLDGTVDLDRKNGTGFTIRFQLEAIQPKDVS